MTACNHPERATEIRAYAVALTAHYGRAASNASYHLGVLADVLDGVPLEWAGVHCAVCGDSLRESGHRREISESVEEIVCISCLVTGRES